MEIKEDTNLAEIFKNPKFVKILEKYNLPCVDCIFAKAEIEKLKLGDVCRMYGIDIKKLLKELNKMIQ